MPDDDFWELHLEVDNVYRGFRGPGLPDRLLRLGVRYPDGRKTTTLDRHRQEAPRQPAGWAAAVVVAWRRRCATRRAGQRGNRAQPFRHVVVATPAVRELRVRRGMAAGRDRPDHLRTRRRGPSPRQRASRSITGPDNSSDARRPSLNLCCCPGPSEFRGQALVLISIMLLHLSQVSNHLLDPLRSLTRFDRLDIIPQLIELPDGPSAGDPAGCFLISSSRTSMMRPSC